MQLYDEENLIAECRNNNRKAQQQLYERYHRKMYVAALRYSKTTFEAEDILQEAFVKIFQAITEFRGESSLEHWIRRIVVFTALKHNRRKLDKAAMSDINDLPPAEEPSGDLLLSQYHFAQLLQFIQQLAPGYQTIFNLYAIEGYKHHEIAEMLDISEGTSKSQYARAKAMLQAMLQNEEKKVYEQT